MEYVVYIDVYFLTDCFFNILALYLTAILLRMPSNNLRCLTAAMIGSFWNCVLLLYPIQDPKIKLSLTVFGVGTIMSSVMFGGDWYRELRSKDTGMNSTDPISIWVHLFRNCVKADLVLVLSSMILGGFVSFIKEQCFLRDWEILIVAGLITAAAGLIFAEILIPSKLGKERYSAALFYKGNSRTFTALADSGNRLRVPETGKPVVLVSYESLKGFCDRVSGGFYIPYRSVGTEHGLLFAITFEKMEIRKNGTCITIENPAVAIVKESLSSNGDFNMLLPEEYVTEISGCRPRRRKSL